MTDVSKRMIATVFALAIAVLADARAQDIAAAPPPPVSGMAMSSAEQLDQMLAPIALYPDALVSQILIYVADSHMTRGSALVAFPAKYGDSGIMTFIVNQDGIVYQKDLGPKTRSLARRMSEFDPGNGWKAVEAK